MATHSSIFAWRIMDRGAWQATVHKVAKSWTQIKQLSTHALMHACAFCLNRLNIPFVENLGNGRKEEKKRTLVLPPSWVCMYNSCLYTLKFLFGHWLIFSSVAQSCLTLRPHGLQHARLPCPSPALGACSNSSPTTQWCHPTISSSVVPFSCLQSFPASGSFPMSQFFT